MQFERLRNLLVACLLWPPVVAHSAAQNTFPSTGNVGIGTTTPSTKLHVVETTSDASYAETLNVEQLMAAGTTATHYIKAIDVEKYWYNIPSGITSNGYQIGLASQVFVSDTNFRGTLASQYGIWTRTGINIAGNEGPRRIYNAYGIYIEGLSGAGAIDNHYGVFQTGTGTKNYFAGNVGIGTNAPRSRLDLGSSMGAGKGARFGDYLEINERETVDNALTIGWNAYIEADNGTFSPAYAPGSGMVLTMASGGLGDLDFLGKNWGGSSTPQGLSSFTHVMRLSTGGNVGIGTTNPTHKLAVNGTIRAKEIIVDTGWADYVFADDYELESLEEVATYIREHRHLPGVPPAAKIIEDGLSIGEMQTLMMAKIEELTLHLIEQARRSEAQDRRIDALERENARLRNSSTDVTAK